MTHLAIRLQCLLGAIFHSPARDDRQRVGCRITWTLPAIGALIALLVTTSIAFAQVAPRAREFIYGFNIYNGNDFSTGVIPKAINSIFVIANTDNVIDPKMSEVYFWPITNEYLADLATLNELVPGTLEIQRNGQVVSTVPLTDYVVQFDRENNMAHGKVFLGDEAQKAWQSFTQSRQGYLEKSRAYADAMEAFYKQLEELKKRSEAGEKVTVPSTPNQPAALTMYSTEVSKGFPIRLAEGEYRVRVRNAEGAIVPDSEKKLVVIAPRRQGIGYEVVPQQKWTVPENANDPSNAIYTSPGGVVYLRPFNENEYNALAFARLQKPQDVTATSNRWTWARTSLITGATLRMRGGGGTADLATEEFAVKQQPGVALGYTVEPFERRPDDPPPGTMGAPVPDLVAFRVAAPSSPARYSLALLDGQGKEQPGSTREFIVIPGVPDWQLALPVIVPLFIGLTIALWRREQVLSRRALSPEKRQLIA